MTRVRTAYKRLKSRDFQSWVAVLTIANVFMFFSNPGASPVHELTSPWDSLWALTYGMAGVLMFIGIVRERSAHIEAAGLMLLIAGALVQAMVFIPLIGKLSGVNVGYSIATLLLLVWAASARVGELFRNTRLLGGNANARD